MKSISNVKLELEMRAKDCFLYMENLFVVDQQNCLKCINLNLVYHKYLSQYDDIVSKPLFSIFIDNRKLNPSVYEKTENYKSSFVQKWNQLIPNPLKLKIEKSDWKHLIELPDPHILDFIVYAKKIIIACRSGVYEANLDIGKEAVEVVRKLDRIHEVKAHSLLTKIGELLILSNFEGVFRGSLWKNYQRLSIENNPIIENSNRVSWFNNDLINYKDKSNYFFYQNEVVEVKESIDGIDFSEDGNKKNYRVKNYGTRIVEITDKVSRILNLDNIIYTFNSNNYLFILNTEGYIKAIQLNKHGEVGEYFNIGDNNGGRLDISNLGSPLSAHMIGFKGVAFEFFDTIISLKDNAFEVVSKTEALQIKSYPNSKNYQNILTVVGNKSVDLHSFLPFPKGDFTKIFTD